MALKLRRADERFIPQSTRAASFKRLLGGTVSRGAERGSGAQSRAANAIPTDSTRSFWSRAPVVRAAHSPKTSHTPPLPGPERVHGPRCAKYTKSSASNRTLSHPTGFTAAPAFAIPPTNIFGPRDDARAS